jgi:hypothetical protein
MSDHPTYINACSFSQHCREIFLGGVQPLVGGACLGLTAWIGWACFWKAEDPGWYSDDAALRSTILGLARQTNHQTGSDLLLSRIFFWRKWLPSLDRETNVNSYKWTKRSQLLRCFIPAFPDVNVFCTLWSSWMSLIFAGCLSGQLYSSSLFTIDL